MSTRETVIGMIEVEISDDRNLAAVFESLVEPPSPGDGERAVLYRVRSGETAGEAVPADLDGLTESLESELQRFLQRLQRA